MEIFHENEAPWWLSHRALALGIGVKGLISRYDIPKTFWEYSMEQILLLGKNDLIWVAFNSRLFIKNVLGHNEQGHKLNISGGKWKVSKWQKKQNYQIYKPFPFQNKGKPSETLKLTTSEVHKF